MPYVVTLGWRGRPTRGEPAELLKALGPLSPRFQPRLGARRVHTASYLDTADWRLRRGGLELTHEGASGPGSLVLAPHSVKLTEPPVWPARIEALPGGELRDAIATAVGVRALAPKIRSRTVVREIVLCDGEGEETARLRWAEAGTLHPVRKPPLVRVTVLAAPGRRRDAKWVARTLLSGEDFEPADAVGYDQLLDACGLPGETGRYAITPGMPADAAVATALLGFAEAITSNVEGTVDDVDPEFLHDLRVAVRRTRSLLKVAGDVLPGNLAARFAPRFAELGELTTPTRDLDVYLLEFDALADSLVAGAPEDLAPFAEHLRRRRDAERKILVRGLRAQRFARLMESWRAALSGVVAAPDRHSTVDDLTAERLRRITKRVIRRAAAITPESPAEDVHALRKRAKELRYALEVFQPVRPADRGALKELKRLQDVLGAFQDGEVQSTKLRAYAQELLDAGLASAPTLLAMGELLGGFARRERAARAELTGALARFLAQTRPVASASGR
ncbi:CHAD domain-containing protein [Amycolatopsis dongchuanensis]|uniref:CHAD domain-containing protein n=1 Tax=Amycolatopsis dongchuanensis TaxID=1070866 RepID=A0ABP8VEP0_9PSEU